MQKPVFVVMLLAIGSLLTALGFFCSQMLESIAPSARAAALEASHIDKIDARLAILERDVANLKALSPISSVPGLSETNTAAPTNPLADLLNKLPKELWPVVTVYNDPNTKARADWVKSNVIAKTLTLTGTIKSVEPIMDSDHPEVPVSLELPVVEIWSDTPRFLVSARFPDMSVHYFSGKQSITFTGKIQAIELAPFTGTLPRLMLTDCRIVTK